MGGSNFPTKLAPEGGQLYSLAGAAAEGSVLSSLYTYSLGGPSHCLVPVSHAKSPAGQGGPTGHVRNLERERAGILWHHTQPSSAGGESAGPVPPRSAVEPGAGQMSL